MVLIYNLKAETDDSFLPVKGKGSKNPVKFSKTCTLRCLINGEDLY